MSAAERGGLPPVGSLEGHYAGAFTRLTAYLIDSFLAVALYAMGTTALVLVVRVVLREDIEGPGEGSRAWLVGLVVWLTLYYGYCWSAAGKTPGKAIMGIRIVARDGSDLAAWRALVRLAAYPVSFLVFGLGMVGIVVGRERRALHDVLARSAVVYDWDARAARLRFLSRRRADPTATGARTGSAGPATG